jgi:putative transcriptional regulator
MFWVILKLLYCPHPKLTHRLLKEMQRGLLLTQNQLADSLGVTYLTVNRWENRRAKLSPLATKQIEAKLQGIGHQGADLWQQHIGE